MSSPALFRPRMVTLGDGWAGSSVNCVPFRQRAVLPLAQGWLMAFYNADGAVVLCRVDARLRRAGNCVIASPVLPHDAHACISLGRDAQGIVHAVFGAHASTAWHVRVPADLSRPLHEPLAPGPDAGRRFTYPMLLSANGQRELAMLYREGGPWQGEIRIMRWNAAADRFESDAAALLSGMIAGGAGPYLNRLVGLPDGRVAMFVVWRLAPTLSTAGDVANTGIDLVMLDPTLQTLATEDGIGLARPVTPVNAPRIWGVPVGRNLMNQAGAALAPDGRAWAMSYWNDTAGIPQFHLLRHHAGLWRAGPISRFTTRFELTGRGTLPLPHARPDFLIRPDGTLLCLVRSHEFSNRLMLLALDPPYERHRARMAVLLDEDLGHYEPVLDHETFARDGSLVAYVQACRQGLGDTAQPRCSAAARLLHWSADQVGAW